jgi:hypothetical protein
MYIWPKRQLINNISNVYDMKIFTKFLIPVILIASCFSGYGASVALGVRGEGVYMPVKTANAEANVSTGLSKSGSFLAGNNFKGACESALNKFAFKGISSSKKPNYTFTADANTNSIVGLNMINNQNFDEGRMKMTLSAYPNPTKGLIQIELQSVNEASKMQMGRDTYKINFSNTIGKVLKTIKVPKSALDSKINLDLSDYPAGVYFYSLLVNDKMVETKRLILQQ